MSINPIKDKRGEFIKIYPSQKDLIDSSEYLINFSPKDVFITKSYKNVFRGMHRQVEPSTCSKLVYLIDGEIIDYLVDLDDVSSSLDICVKSYVLNSDDKNLLFVPENYAHGFRVLSDSVSLLYIYSGEYSYSHDISINLFDFIPDLDANSLIMSDRDVNSISLEDYIKLVSNVEKK